MIRTTKKRLCPLCLRPMLCAMILSITCYFVINTPLYATENTPIYAIQGQSDISPMEGQRVNAYGIVTSVLDNGFYLQDPLGDDDPLTSDGILVYTGRKPQVQLGDCIQVENGLVDEYYDKTEKIEAVSIPMAQLRQDPQTLFEKYEGMLVTLPSLSGVVQGPTKRFSSGDVELAFVPSQLEPYLDGGAVFRWQTENMAALMYLSNELGQLLPELDWGEQFSIAGPVRAILDYNFGKYQLMLLPGHEITIKESAVVDPSPYASVDIAPDSQSDFSICTFNVLGLGEGTAQYRDDDEYADQLHKRALTIAKKLQGCTIIGLQETGKPADAENLADVLRAEFDLDYEVTAIKGPNTSSFEFPLTNSFLTRRDRVTVSNAELVQGCSRFNYDVRYMPGTCKRGTFGLFSRPPLVIDVMVQGDWGQPYEMTLINNHWKSKGGNEEVNVIRREAQAEHVASLVQARLDGDPQRKIVVLGDLNDFPDSQPVSALLTAPEPDLIHLLALLPTLNRYTYTFNGAHQVLDHMVASPAVLPELAGIWPIHINADYAYPATVDPNSVYHSSDHDPVMMRLRPMGAAAIGGQLGFADIRVTLWADETAVADTVTDALGEFRLWDIAPGDYKLRYELPDYLMLSSALLTQNEFSITLNTGFITVAPINVEHAAIQTAVAAALIGPYLGQAGE